MPDDVAARLRAHMDRLDERLEPVTAREVFDRGGGTGTWRRRKRPFWRSPPVVAALAGGTAVVTVLVAMMVSTTEQVTTRAGEFTRVAPEQATGWGPLLDVVVSNSSVWVARGSTSEGQSRPGGLVPVPVGDGSTGSALEMPDLAAVAGGGEGLYAATSDGNAIDLVDPVAGSVHALSSLDDGERVEHLAVADRYLWVATNEARILRLDARHGAHEQELRVDAARIYALTAEGARGAAALGRDGVVLLRAGEPGYEQLPLETSQGPVFVNDVATHGQYVFAVGTVITDRAAGDRKGVIARVDSTTEEVLEVAEVPEPIGWVAVVADEVWMLGGQGGLYRVDGLLNGTAGAPLAIVPGEPRHLVAREGSLWTVSADVRTVWAFDVAGETLRRIEW